MPKWALYKVRRYSAFRLLCLCRFLPLATPKERGEEEVKLILSTKPDHDTLIVSIFRSSALFHWDPVCWFFHYSRIVSFIIFSVHMWLISQIDVWHGEQNRCFTRSSIWERERDLTEGWIPFSAFHMVDSFFAPHFPRVFRDALRNRCPDLTRILSRLMNLHFIALILYLMIDPHRSRPM